MARTNTPSSIPRKLINCVRKRSRDEEKKRDHALAQDPYFDYAEALLQIAIVLISISIVAEQTWLSYIGGGLGLIGGLVMVNGYLLLVHLPFLG
jgi:hypothetical protein